MNWWCLSNQRCIDEFLIECNFKFLTNGFQLQFVPAKDSNLKQLRMYFRIGLYKMSPYRVYNDIGLFYRTERPTIAIPINQPYGFNVHKALHPESDNIVVQLVDCHNTIVAEGKLPVSYCNEHLSCKAHEPSWCRYGESALQVFGK